MDPLRHEYRQRLIEGISLLTKLLPSLDASSEQGAEAVRKLAASLRRSSAGGYPQLTAAATPFETAPRGALPMLTRRLLRVLESVATSGWDVKHRILVVDADTELAEELGAKLEAPTREVLVATSVEEAWRIIDDQEIALVVLDLVLPDADGRNLISQLRSDPRTGPIPIVVLSDWGGHDERAECFALGADQFFQKSGDRDLLAVAVASTLHRSIGKVRDTRHDALTRLLSREGLREKYQRAVKRIVEKEEPVSLVVLDVDLSELHGEISPEEFLHALAGSIRRVLRPTDAISRWGEFELVLLLGDTAKKGAARALERIRESLAEEPLEVGGSTYPTEFAAGVVAVTADLELEEAVAEADRALFAERLVRRSGRIARDSGRPRILIADIEAENAFLARRHFGSDFEVLHLQSGRQTLKTATVGRIRLIMLDLKLPDMTGLELVDRLRGMPRLAQVPLIMTTAHGRDLDAAHAFEKGVDDYIVKPCTSTAVVARMRRLLKRTGPPSSGPFKVIRKHGAMAGLFAGDQLWELVQMVGLNRKTGRLIVVSETNSGHMDFLEGTITGAWATLGAREGAAACEALLALQAGRFEFWPGNDAVSMSGELLQLNVDNMLLDAMRRRDEAGLGPM